MTTDTTPAQQYLRPLVDRRVLIAVVTVLVTAVGVGVAYLAPTSYESSTTIVVYPISGDPAKTLEADDSNVDMATQLRIATSQAVVDVVAEKLADQSIRLSSDEISDNVTASTTDDSRVLDIAFLAGSPDVARVGADTFAEAYLEFRADLANGNKLAAETTINGRIAVLQEQLADVSVRLSTLNAASATAVVLAVEESSIRGELTAQQAALADLSTLSVDPTRVIDEADVPSSPEGISLVQTVVGSLAGGLVLGVIAAYAAAALSEGDRSNGRRAGGGRRSKAKKNDADTEPDEHPSGAGHVGHDDRAGRVESESGEPETSEPPMPATDPMSSPTATEPTQDGGTTDLVEPADAATAATDPAPLVDPLRNIPPVLQDSADDDSPSGADDPTDSPANNGSAAGDDHHDQSQVDDELFDISAATDTNEVEGDQAPAEDSEVKLTSAEADALSGPSSVAGDQHALVTKSNTDDLIDQLQSLGTVGPVVALSVGDNSVSSPLAVAFELAGELQTLGAKVLLIDAAVEEPMLHSLLRVEPFPGLSDVLSGRTPLPQAARPLPGIDGLDALTIGSVDTTTATSLTTPSFERLLDEARNAYHLTLVVGGNIHDDTIVPSLADNCDGLILSTARVAGEEARPDLVQRLASLPAPTLDFISAVSASARLEEAIGAPSM